MLSDGITALATLALPLIFMFGEKALPLVFLTAAIRAIGTAIQGPAVGAILPQFVPTEQLTRINGISGSIQGVIMIIRISFVIHNKRLLDAGKIVKPQAEPLVIL